MASMNDVVLLKALIADSPEFRVEKRKTWGQVYDFLQGIINAEKGKALEIDRLEVADPKEVRNILKQHCKDLKIKGTNFFALLQGNYIYKNRDRLDFRVKM